MLRKLFALFERLVTWATLGLSSLILLYLTWQLTGMRAYMPLTTIEDMIFVDQWPSFLVCVVLFIGCLLLLSFALRKVTDRQLFWGLTLFYLLAGAYLISHVDPLIRADARRVFEAAQAMNMGDYTSLLKQGAYLYLHPHQLGLATLDRFYLLFSDSPKLIFAANLGLVLMTIFCQNIIVRNLYPNRLVSKYQLVLAFSFFPQFFFILFAYGSIPGACLIFLASACLMIYHKSKRWYWAVLGVVAASLAGIIRNNYQIFLIALVILWLAAYGKTRLKRYLFLPLGLVASFVLFSQGLTLAYQSAIGQPLSPGVPKIAYVTMGLQEDPKGAVGGWWNTYNTKLLRRNKYDQEKAKEQAITDLKTEIDRLASDPDAAQLFFQKKAHSTWLDPTFQSIWTGPIRAREQQTYGILPIFYEPGNGYDWFNHYGAVWLWTVYGLSTLWWLVARQKTSPSDWLFDLLPFIFFLGGFFFHLLWETKSQYVLVYVFALIQPAAAVLGTIAEQFSDHREAFRKIVSTRRP